MERALDGVKILDFSHLLQGPFAAQMLGDLGADVIKVEKTGAGDMFRGFTFFNYYIGGEETPCYMAFNRNKRSLSLNLKSAESKEIVRRLARDCDVVIQNFRPGVMDKLGFGYADFHKINPRIIYCSGSGYGEHGPYVARPGQDLLMQSITGLAMMTGRAGGPPTPLGTGIADQIGAHHMVQGILSALYYREKTGKGQKIEINLFQGLLAHQLQEFVTTLNAGREFERPASGIGHPGTEAPFGIYEAADGWLAIAMNPIGTLGEVLEDEGLKAFDDPKVLFEQRDQLFDRIQSVVRTRPRAYWMEKMLERDLWVAEVKTHLEVAEDPQAKHLEAFTTIHHPKAGDFKTVNIPIHFSETPGGIYRHPPMVGEHNEEILRDAGYTSEEIRRFKENRVI